MAHNRLPVAQSRLNYDANEFRELVLEGDWEKVIEKYKQDCYFHTIEIKGIGTALHAAISIASIDEVRILVEAIDNVDDESCLRMVNEIGATPLHLAAFRGLTDVCQLIIRKGGERKHLIKEKNHNGETPLFWAVLGDHSVVFDYLHQFYPHDLNIALNKHNTSILHVAIWREMFDLAIKIMHCYQVLSSMKDKDDFTPLKILATKTSALEPSRLLLPYQRILLYCTTISLNDAESTVELYQKNVKSKENAKNEEDDYSKVAIPLFDVEELGNSYKRQRSLAHSYICIQKFVFRWKFPSLAMLDAIKTIKKKQIYSRRLLNEFMKNPTESYIGGGDDPIGDIEYDDKMKDEFPNFSEFIKHAREGGDASMQETKEYKEIEDLANINVKGREDIMEDLNSKVPITIDKKGLFLVTRMNNETESSEKESPGKDSAFLIAASFGTVEMMKSLKSNIRSVIHETNTNNQNALLLAVKNRKSHVVQWLMENLPKAVFENLKLQVDNNQNTMLHLVSYTRFDSQSTWRITDPDIQLTWELKWYEYIKKLVPEDFKQRRNIEGKTPSEIFEEQHKELLEKSVDSLKTKAESCSVVAALVVGVTFATSISVPGGNQPTGEPALKGKSGFEGFGISSLIGFNYSVLALIMFLTILTSRKGFQEFRIKLPMQLLLGMSSLFGSIVAMVISFAAGNSFVLGDEYRKGGVLFYLFIPTSLAVPFFIGIQFNLVVNLFILVFKKVPLPSLTTRKLTFEKIISHRL